MRPLPAGTKVQHHTRLLRPVARSSGDGRRTDCGRPQRGRAREVEPHQRILERAINLVAELNQPVHQRNCP